MPRRRPFTWDLDKFSTANAILNRINQRVLIVEDANSRRLARAMAYLRSNLRERWPRMRPLFHQQLNTDLTKLFHFLNHDEDGGIDKFERILQGNLDTVPLPEIPKVAPWREGTVARSLGHYRQHELSQRQRVIYG
ncbi:hypothetical protein JCM3766R1_003925 [Sporobolomyces carnicolor]